MTYSVIVIIRLSKLPHTKKEREKKQVEICERDTEKQRHRENVSTINKRKWERRKRWRWKLISVCHYDCQSTGKEATSFYFNFNHFWILIPCSFCNSPGIPHMHPPQPKHQCKLNGTQTTPLIVLPISWSRAEKLRLFKVPVD